MFNNLFRCIYIDYFLFEFLIFNIVYYCNNFCFKYWNVENKNTPKS